MYQARRAARIEQTIRESQELRAQNRAVMDHAISLQEYGIKRRIRNSPELHAAYTAWSDEYRIKRRIRQSQELQAKSRPVQELSDNFCSQDTSQLLRENRKVLAECRAINARMEALLADKQRLPDIAATPAWTSAYLSAAGTHPRSCSPDIWMEEAARSSSLPSVNHQRVPTTSIQVAAPVKTVPRKSSLKTTGPPKSLRVRFSQPDESTAAWVSSISPSPPLRLQSSPAPSDSSDLSFASVLSGTSVGARSVSPPSRLQSSPAPPDSSDLSFASVLSGTSYGGRSNLSTSSRASSTLSAEGFSMVSLPRSDRNRASSTLSAEGFSMLSIPRSDRSLSAEGFSAISHSRIRAFRR